MPTNRIMSLVVLFLIVGCAENIHPQKNSADIDQIGIEFEKLGIRGVEFFDSKVTLHMPFRGIMSCGNRPCEFKNFIPNPLDTALLGPALEDSLVSWETKLREYSADIRSRMPEQGRMIVGIGVTDESKGKDVLGVVLPILERYLIRPDTVELVSIPLDSVQVSTNKGWLLVGDSVVFRHIVDVKVQRFVRR